MPRDIRSFFIKSPKVAAAEKKRATTVNTISSDEDEPSAGSSSKQEKKVTSKRGRQAIASDSDDDVKVVKAGKGNPKDKKTEKKEQLKPAAPHELFGKKPIKRVSAPVVSKEIQKKEAEFHDDDDFADTLMDLDTSQIESDYFNSVSKEGNAKKDNGDLSVQDAQTEEAKPRLENAASVNGDKRINGHDKKSPNKTASSSSSVSTKKKKTAKSVIVIEKTVTKTKKAKDDESEAVDVYAENIEKKKQRAMLYDRYMQRGGARNPDSKPIPEGANNCLAGLNFVITGVLESLERDQADELIKKYAGRVSAQPSKKTDYMVVGDEAGPAKLAKAASFKIKQISEDDLLDLIRTRPEGKSSAIPSKPGSSKAEKRTRSPDKTLSSPSSKKMCLPTKRESPQQPPKVLSPSPEQQRTEKKSGDVTMSNGDSSIPAAPALVEKYRPKSMKQIIGQHGDKSNAKKLDFWLKNWHKNQSGTTKIAKPSLYAKNDDGAFFKACLLSGPPGVGKTTTAQVVCAELGFDLLEFNASDTRSKRLLKEEISGILSNTTVKGYFGGASDRKLSKQHVLLMDEVDGMAGNEDRGGLQELIALIKSSEIPIICICNDRNHPKMRTLSNYTFDLRFQKPRLEQIRGAMKSMCCKEKIDISTEDLDRLIQSTNQDIRQVINHLAMLSGGSGSEKKPEDKRMNKDLRLGPWDVITKVFSAEQHKDMSIHDKSDLFFHDYNIAALFVQENYLSVTPKAPRDEVLERVAKTAESLAMGDLIENAIRGQGAWSLLPTQACFSSVIPGSLMSGNLTARANFPAWLGRNSKRGKFDRLLQELTVHSRLVTGSSKEAINLDYINHLRDAVIRPLALNQAEGIEESLNVMNHYHFLRDDLESLVEVSLWPGQRDPLQSIDSKVKAAFTRAYNKSSAPAPYLMNAAAPKKKANQGSQDEGFLEGEEEEVSDGDGDGDDMDSDRMIKAKKATATSSKAATGSKTAPKPAKRGRGRGKAK